MILKLVFFIARIQIITAAPSESNYGSDDENCDTNLVCGQIVNLEDRVIKLENALSVAVELIQGQQEELKSHQNEIETLKASQNEINSEMDILQEDVDNLEDEIIPGKLPASCTELGTRGETKNGIYEIRPSLELDSFYVTCDFDAVPPKTIIKHDHDTFGATAIPGQGNGCQEAGCYSDTISYDATDEQIFKLIDISEGCQQSIKNNCTNNGLTNIAWWTDRNGDEHQYWHGEFTDDTQGCACSMEGDNCRKDDLGTSVSPQILSNLTFLISTFAIVTVTGNPTLTLGHLQVAVNYR